MLGLPKSTETSKQLPKKAVYTKFAMNTAAKEKFDEDISRITIVNEVSPATCNIAKGEAVGSFYVLSVLLKHKDYDEKIIAQLSKLIPQNILFLLVCETECQMAIYHSKLMHTEWQTLDTAKIELKGLSLDSVWENIIVQVGGVQIEQGHTLDEQIAVDEKRKKLLKEIDRVEKLARKERQPKKKFELADQVKALQKQLDALGTVTIEIAPKTPTVVITPKEIEITMQKKTETVPVASGTTVKALSIMPPYAMDIFDGLKTVEWRSWKTDYRGDLLICSSSRKCEGCISGHALCMVELVDVVPFTRKHLNGALMDEIPDPAGYAWILRNVRNIVPFPYKGKLHIYDVDASLVKVLSPRDSKEAEAEFDKYYKPLIEAAGGERW